MFRLILVPLDGSRYSRRALSYAEDIARHYSANLLLLNVVKPSTPIVATTGVSPVAESPVSTRMATEAALQEDRLHISKSKRYLSRKVRDLKSQKIEASYQVVKGEPANSIIRVAQKTKTDLIIMTTHGKGGIKRAILGSVTDNVTRNATAPVLVVNPQTRIRKSA